MRVLLLNPPAPGGQSRDGRCQTEGSAWLSAFPPTTFASIAGCVRQKHELLILDCIGSGMQAEGALAAAKAFGPDFVILNTSTPTIDSDLLLAGGVRAATGAKITAYGEYVSARRSELVAGGRADYAICGEPETPIMNLLAGRPKSAGVAFAGWDGGHWTEPDLDSLPFPAYDLLPPYSYPLTGERWMFVRTGRGCPHKCVFCVEPAISPRPRHHSVGYLMRQFKWLRDVLGIGVFMFWEETATLDRAHMLRLCDAMVADGLAKRVKWMCTTRVDRFDDGLAAGMRAAGCVMVSFGFESGVQEVLDANCKGITLEQSRRAAESAKRNGLRTIGHFIIGLMGDTPERARRTGRFARELRLDFAQFYVATPFHSSEFRSIAVKNGWLLEGAGAGASQAAPLISYPDFTSGEMQKARREAYIRFYLRPGPVWSSIAARSPVKILSMPLQALSFSRWALR
jgi:anaerobic magnesium-protoporphyrin IX monomethyl ester cyclase